MLTVAWIPLLICLAGLVVYALTANPKPQRLAWWAYATGLIVSVWVLARLTLPVHLP